MPIKNSSRRDFILNTGKATLAAGLSFSVLPTLANELIKVSASGQFFAQQPLPYAYKDLEPVIDALTMEIHFSKHAAAYLKNLNEAAAAEVKSVGKITLEEILKNISKYSTKMRNNAGGHYNHEFFWQCMLPNNTSKPSSKLSEAIVKTFGSYENFKTQFSDAGKTRFGSGWAWLIVTPDKQLKIYSTPNQDNPLMDIAEMKGMPVLALDVWEHAYYLKYQNKRADYINNWLGIINWNFVSQQFDKALL
jgi:Fe-Mn family superoxide dismutase